MDKRVLILLSLMVVLFASCDKRLSRFRQKNLNGVRVGLLASSMQEQRAKATWTKGVFLSYPTNDDVFRALSEGKIDVAYLDELIIYNQNYQDSLFELAFIDNDHMPIAGAFRKSDTALAEQFNGYLKKIKSNGMYVRMKNRWTTTERIDTITPPEITYRYSRVCRPFVVGIIGDMRPYSIMNDGQWTGFENELWARFAAYIGCYVQFEVYDFDQLIPALLSKRVDAIAAAITITDERKQQVLFTDQYSSSCSVCLVRK